MGGLILIMFGIGAFSYSLLDIENEKEYKTSLAVVTPLSALSDKALIPLMYALANA